MTVEVWNRKRLPLAWLRADDDATFGVVVRERELVDRQPGQRRAPQRLDARPVRARHARLTTSAASGEASTSWGPVDLAVGDLFAREAAVEERNDRRPVPRPAANRRRRPASSGPTSGAAPSDRRPAWPRIPSRFAGVREYAPGDPAPPDPPPSVAPASAAGHEAVRAVARPRGADRPRRPDGPRPGLGDRVRPRRCRVAVRRRRVHRPGAGRGEGGVRARRGRVHRRRDALRDRPDLVVGRPGRAGPRPAGPPVHARRRRRSSGCSRSSGGSPGRGRRSSSSRPATRRRSRAGSAGSRPAAAASSSSPVGSDAVGDAARARSAGFSARPARLNGPWQTASALEVAS